jgi:hypothetical protein
MNLAWTTRQLEDSWRPFINLCVTHVSRVLLVVLLVADYLVGVSCYVVCLSLKTSPLLLISRDLVTACRSGF